MKNSTAKPNSKSNFKMYAILTVLVVTLFIGLYGYLQYKKYSRLINSANDYQAKVFEYEQVRLKIDSEIESCKTIIADGEGEFAKFEYCKEFLNVFDTAAPVLE